MYKRLLFLIVVAAACGKEDTPGPTNSAPDGTWTYSTPTKAIEVTFELKSTSDTTVTVVNATITVAGVEGNAVGQVTQVDLPSMEMLRINANDAVLVSNYDIKFLKCSVNADFDKIGVADVEYSYPAGTIQKLSNVIIVRKP